MEITCKWCDRKGAECCGVYRLRGIMWECTRPKGHRGDHVACGYVEHKIAVWRGKRTNKQTSSKSHESVVSRISKLEKRDQALHRNYAIPGTMLVRTMFFPPDSGWGWVLALGPLSQSKSFYGPRHTIEEALEDAEIAMTNKETNHAEAALRKESKRLS